MSLFRDGDKNVYQYLHDLDAEEYTFSDLQRVLGLAKIIKCFYHNFYYRRRELELQNR